MELVINNINKMVYEQAREAFRRFINDEYEGLEGVTVALRADEISISYSKDALASDLVTIHLYTRSLSAGVKGFTGIFQLESTDFWTIQLS